MIFTNGKVQAAVHPVVACNDAKMNNAARMSSPFVLRSRNRIAMDVQKHFGSESGDIFNTDNGKQSALQSLSCLLWKNL